MCPTRVEMVNVHVKIHWKHSDDTRRSNKKKIKHASKHFSVDKTERERERKAEVVLIHPLDYIPMTRKKYAYERDPATNAITRPVSSTGRAGVEQFP